VLLDGDPKQLTRDHGAANLDDLFVQVAHEALHDASHPGLTAAPAMGANP
jgi:hypothetical protein